MIGKVYSNKEYYDMVKDILRNSEFQRRKEFHHHNDSVYDHSLEVSIVSYKMASKLAKILPISVEDTVCGALLHDFYLIPWRDNTEKSLFKMHGFKHASIACDNAYCIFPEYMNKKMENIIKRHMFPLNITPPRYIESWIVTIADKYVSLSVFKQPKELPKYLGIDVFSIKVKTKSVYNFTKRFVTNMY